MEKCKDVHIDVRANLDDIAEINALLWGQYNFENLKFWDKKRKKEKVDESI